MPDRLHVAGLPIPRRRPRRPATIPAGVREIASTCAARKSQESKTSRSDCTITRLDSREPPSPRGRDFATVQWLCLLREKRSMILWIRPRFSLGSASYAKGLAKVTGEQTEVEPRGSHPPGSAAPECERHPRQTGPHASTPPPSTPSFGAAADRQTQPPATRHQTTTSGDDARRVSDRAETASPRETDLCVRSNLPSDFSVHLGPLRL